MSLDALYARDIRANYQRQVSAVTPPPETSFSLWSSLGAGFSGIPGGLLEVTGSGADILAPALAPAQRQVQQRPRPRVLRDQPALRPEAPISGDLFRAKAADFAPDPQTAHFADQALYGIGRFGTKAAAAMLTAGPVAGAALLGAEETNTQYRGLLEKGVDPDTALLTGMTLGVAGAVGVALPISGVAMATTLPGQIAATAGLVAIGGPGLYMAQEAAARQLLGAAGYDAEAATHDPTDPLGLALSTILPGGFGAWSLRNAARQAKAAKMVTPKTEAQAREAAQLSPEEQSASDAFERSEANLAQLRAAIKAEKNPENRAILEQELATQEAAARAAARDPVQPADPETMDAARALQVERALTNNLPDMPNARAMALEAMDEVAAGRFPEIPPAITREEREANFARWFGDSKVVDADGKPLVVYHGTGVDFDSFRTSGLGAHFTGDPSVANRFGQDGRVLPVHLSIKNPLRIADHGGHHDNADGVAQALIDAGVLRSDYMDDAFYSRLMEDGALGNTEKFLANNMAEIERMRGELSALGYDGIVYRNTAEGGGDSYIAFSPAQIKSAIGNSGRFDPESGSLTDPLPDARVTPRPESNNAIPGDDDPSAAAPESDTTAAASPSAAAGDTKQPGAAAPQGKPRDLKAELIAARKAESLLKSLLECLG